MLFTFINDVIYLASDVITWHIVRLYQLIAHRFHGVCAPVKAILTEIWGSGGPANPSLFRHVYRRPLASFPRDDDMVRSVYSVEPMIG